MKYKEIHIWNFPPTLTFVKLNKQFKENLFKDLISKTGSQEKLLKIINGSSLKYNIRRKHSRRNLYSWIKGQNFDRGKMKNIYIPLWVLIESSNIISTKKDKKNQILKKIEKNIKFYTSRGNSNPINKPKLPLSLTPEMISIIFNFLGGGHMGKKQISPSYKQINKEGLTNFLSRLRNIFGDFRYSKGEFKNGRLNIPKVIGDFYQHYFNLTKTNTFDARVPKKIKALKKEFLLAGLISFIVDEGHIGEVITIYSKNKGLLSDIKEICDKIGYISHPIREKYARGKFDVYRFNISIRSYKQINSDINKLFKNFPNCNLAQKRNKLLQKIR
ncbi:MAG: hypothetical protein CMH63_00720 [Nanoarchaeota archaeon]|nr:hypothetical protein [Nanoarchaeota archaeon]|tara:strand:+ start:19265 stop:20254 length:990 start_codon:yes stop_codon:yes gene_type:complete